MKTLFYICSALFTLFLSCKKEDPNWRKNNIVFSTIDIEQTGELTATLRYSMKLSGNPSPDILEYGLIVSTDPEAPFYGIRYESSDAIEQIDHVLNISDLEGDTYWYIRPYARTHRDTVLGKINSFKTGKYFSEGLGVTDIEGNFYKTVKIGNQEWMAESLYSRTFCNGETLTLANNLVTFTQFADSNTVTMSYLFDPSFDTIYGKYYPGTVAFDERNICPCGWRIPTRTDVVELANFVGNNQYLGSKMKSVGVVESGTGLWRYPNVLANNLTGLNVHPGGYFWRGPNIFNRTEYIAQSMIIDYQYNTSGILIEFPSSIGLNYIRRELELWSIGDNNNYVNIRCIKE